MWESSSRDAHKSFASACHKREIRGERTQAERKERAAAEGGKVGRRWGGRGEEERATKEEVRCGGGRRIGGWEGLRG